MTTEQFTIELDPDHYEKITRIAKVAQMPFVEVLIAILEIADEIPMPYAEFDEMLQKLERDSKLLLADWCEHNTRMNAIAQINRNDLMAGDITPRHG